MSRLGWLHCSPTVLHYVEQLCRDGDCGCGSLGVAATAQEFNGRPCTKHKLGGSDESSHVFFVTKRVHGVCAYMCVGAYVCVCVCVCVASYQYIDLRFGFTNMLLQTAHNA